MGEMGCGASGGTVVEGGQKPGSKRPSLSYEDDSAAAKVEEQPKEVDSNEWTRTLGAEFKHHYHQGFKRGDSVVAARKAYRVFSTELDRNFIKKAQFAQLLCALGQKPQGEDFMKEFDENDNDRAELHEFIKAMQKRSAAGMKCEPQNFGFVQVRATSSGGPEEGVWWNDALAREFKRHYDSNFAKRTYLKTVKAVFNLFTNNQPGMNQPQLYRLLELTGFPPNDFHSETIFREFDRNKGGLVEQKELVTGLKRRHRHPKDFWIRRGAEATVRRGSWEAVLLRDLWSRVRS